MRGKILFVTGLAAGYVLGTRAGRARYEQIKSGWLSVWNAAPVQNQVEKVETFTKARLSEIPGLLLTGVKKVASAIAPDESAPETSAKKPAAATSAKPAAKQPAAKKAASTKSTAKGGAAKSSTKKSAENE
ncbi:septal ring-binding cell division protein DamX [Mycetocola sp. BIGb0189]|uniref:hypothetical protein n=1 Tax=Mycetocola sp. BIGb0189 TaxID=2940604 RepID=UPI0021687132|nr:hypothetical protein [Mycetocola sp. BIGb0189]MCS4277996.1 septal ring-binding cell division protein DamX [Mycetocola sp. BIGb0189]